MKRLEVGLCSVWLSGFLLIAISLFATRKLPSLHRHNHISNAPSVTHHLGSPRITIFSAPDHLVAKARLSFMVGSWIDLSPLISVVLFSKDPHAVPFAKAYGSRVVIDPNIDFTFLGTPLFHSMITRSRAYKADISVFIDPECVLLPDFISTLNYAHKLDHDWLLVASARNASYSPFYLDEDGKYWLTENERQIPIHKLQELLAKNPQWIHCDTRMLMAWNNGNLPLHSGVLPPFMYRKGIHNQWILNEVLLSESCLLFDASSTITSFYLDDLVRFSNRPFHGTYHFDLERTRWEYLSNSHLGTLYGSTLFHEINYTRILKLFRSNRQYLFLGSISGTSSRISNEKKKIRCPDGIQLLGGLDCSLTAQLKQLPPLRFPYSLESLLPITADKNMTIVLGIAGYSYKDMLMSWVCRLHRLSITNFLVLALDNETYEFALTQGLPVFSDPLAPSKISFNDCHFGTNCFQRVTKVKSRIVLKILKLGYNVLLSDVDVYWFLNPLPFLHSFNRGVLAAQSDEYNETGPINLPRRLNSGFYFARSDNSTIAGMEKVVKHAASSVLSEQPSFYDTLCGEGGSNRVGDDKCIERETNLTVQFLSRDLFPNGAYLGLWQKRNTKTACLKNGCFVLHNNWINGRLKKLERQLRSGLWEYDISRRMCLHKN